MLNRKLFCHCFLAQVAIWTVICIGGAILYEIEHDAYSEELVEYKSKVAVYDEFINSLQTDLKRKLTDNNLNVLRDGLCQHDKSIEYAHSKSNTVGGYIFVAFTMASTVGYGWHTPSTDEGRIFAIIFGTFSIFLYVASAIYTYGVMDKMSRLVVRKISKEYERLLAIGLQFLVIILYMCLVPFWVLNDSRYDYITLVYFVWQTMTTVGFGDVYMGESSDGSQPTDEDVDWAQHLEGWSWILCSHIAICLFTSFGGSIAKVIYQWLLSYSVLDQYASTKKIDIHDVDTPETEMGIVAGK